MNKSLSSIRNMLGLTMSYWNSYQAGPPSASKSLILRRAGRAPVTSLIPVFRPVIGILSLLIRLAVANMKIAIETNIVPSRIKGQWVDVEATGAPRIELK